MRCSCSSEHWPTIFVKVHRAVSSSYFELRIVLIRNNLAFQRGDLPMKLLARRAMLVLLCTLFAACGSQPVTERNSELTQGNVQMNIQVGVTTKVDVLENFGSPNITTRDGSGQEVWSYQRQAQVSERSESGEYFTVLLAGLSNSRSSAQTTSRMMTLIIKFDENDVVSDFSSRTSNF